MLITRAELARQLEELWGQLTASERRADEWNLEVEELQELLADQGAARSREKWLHFKLNDLDCWLGETQRDLEQTLEELAAARMDESNELELQAKKEVRELNSQIGELNCQLQANQEEMAEAYDMLDHAKWEIEQLGMEMKLEVMRELLEMRCWKYMLEI